MYETMMNYNQKIKGRRVLYVYVGTGPKLNNNLCLYAAPWSRASYQAYILRCDAIFTLGLPHNIAADVRE